jgi:hypothetical protein
MYKERLEVKDKVETSWKDYDWDTFFASSKFTGLESQL